MQYDFRTPTTWIGLLHVRPRDGNNLLEGAVGAMVSVVALASNAENFRSVVTMAALAMDFEVISVEDVEPWVVRKSLSSPSKDVCDLVNTLTEENRVAFGVFDAYDHI